MTPAAPVADPSISRPAEPISDRFLFSGHQTFALRIPWLPKAADAIGQGIDPFADPRKGMELLGIGKNMVEALRCWVELYGVAAFDASGRNPKLTEFGEIVFGARGTDPYLEDERTLWLLHWNGTTNRERRFFAWHWVFNLHAEFEFSYEEALRAFRAHAAGLPKPLSDTTLRQHWTIRPAD